MSLTMVKVSLLPRTNEVVSRIAEVRLRRQIIVHYRDPYPIHVRTCMYGNRSPAYSSVNVMSPNTVWPASRNCARLVLLFPCGYAWGRKCVCSIGGVHVVHEYCGCIIWLDVGIERVCTNCILNQPSHLTLKKPETSTVTMLLANGSPGRKNLQVLKYLIWYSSFVWMVLSR